MGLRGLASLAGLLALLGAQDLYDDRGEIFAERGLPVGSIITLTFDEALKVNVTGNYNRQDQRQVTGDNITGDLFDFFPRASSSGGNTERNQSQVQSTRNLAGSLAAQVQAFDPKSFTYRVSATHTMSINGRLDTVQVTGTVASRDLGSGRTVSSRKLANLFITYKGYAIGRDKVLTARDFTNLVFSVNTNATNSAQLTPEKKKELWLEQFNRLFNELF